MGSVICIIIASAVDSSFESSSFRAIELFFFFFVIFDTIQVNYLVNYHKHVFDYHEHIFIHVIITLAYAIRFKESTNQVSLRLNVIN